MACMEHECDECGHIWFNNKPGGNCPICGSPYVRHTFDEAF
jgi:rubrerythrin